MKAIAGSRLLSTDVLADEVDCDGVSVALETASQELGQLGAVEVGLWEAGPGRDTDVESEEVFLVLAGAGTITFEDGSSIALKPGVLVRLAEGDRTRWDITARLRKLYLL